MTQQLRMATIQLLWRYLVPLAFGGAFYLLGTVLAPDYSGLREMCALFLVYSTYGRGLTGDIPSTLPEAIDFLVKWTSIGASFWSFLAIADRIFLLVTTLPASICGWLAIFTATAIASGFAMKLFPHGDSGANSNSNVLRGTPPIQNQSNLWGPP